MSKLLDKEFWNAALGRSLRTFLQTFLSGVTIGYPLWANNLSEICGIALASAVYSIFTSMIFVLPETQEDKKEEK